MLDTYLSKLPPIAFEKDILYWKPKCDTPKSSTEPWYHCQPVGKHKLSSMVVTICAEAGLSQRKQTILSALLVQRHCTLVVFQREKSSSKLVTVPMKHLGNMSAPESSSTNLFQICFHHLWKCLIHLTCPLFIVRVQQPTLRHLVVFHCHIFTLPVSILEQEFHQNL